MKTVNVERLRRELVFRFHNMLNPEAIQECIDAALEAPPQEQFFSVPQEAVEQLTHAELLDMLRYDGARVSRQTEVKVEGVQKGLYWFFAKDAEMAIAWERWQSFGIVPVQAHNPRQRTDEYYLLDRLTKEHRKAAKC